MVREAQAIVRTIGHGTSTTDELGLEASVLRAANLQANTDMCLTCGCMDAHLEMGKSNITYDDVKAAADENGNTVAETVDIIERTIAKDRGEHPPEYEASSSGA